jgi:hypothetical protein
MTKLPRVPAPTMAKFLYPDMFLLLGAIYASPFIYVFLAPMGGTHSSHQPHFVDPLTKLLIKKARLASRKGPERVVRSWELRTDQWEEQDQSSTAAIYYQLSQGACLCQSADMLIPLPLHSAMTYVLTFFLRRLKTRQMKSTCRLHVTNGALILLYILLRCYITITSSLSPSKRTTHSSMLPIPCLSALGSFHTNLPHVLFEMKCEIMLKKPDA